MTALKLQLPLLRFKVTDDSDPHRKIRGCYSDDVARLEACYALAVARAEAAERYARALEGSSGMGARALTAEAQWRAARAAHSAAVEEQR